MGFFFTPVFLVLPVSPYDSPLLNSFNQSEPSSLFAAEHAFLSAKSRKITLQCVALFSSRLSWLQWEKEKERLCVCVIWAALLWLLLSCDHILPITGFTSNVSAQNYLHLAKLLFPTSFMFLILDSGVWMMASRQYWHCWFLIQHLATLGILAGYLTMQFCVCLLYVLALTRWSSVSLVFPYSAAAPQEIPRFPALQPIIFYLSQQARQPGT